MGPDRLTQGGPTGKRANQRTQRPQCAIGKARPGRWFPRVRRRRELTGLREHLDAEPDDENPFA